MLFLHNRLVNNILNVWCFTSDRYDEMYLRHIVIEPIATLPYGAICRNWFLTLPLLNRYKIIQEYATNIIGNLLFHNDMYDKY